MPVYLFTFHAYRSWMPDRPRGYVRRKEGILPTSQTVANIYRQQASEEEVKFGGSLQKMLIEEAIKSCEKQNWQLQAVGSDPTHVHVLLSWNSSRTWLQVRVSLKSSLSRKLNQQIGRRKWFSEGASRKRVTDQKHFNYLTTTYLPKHAGWKWDVRRGFFR